MSRSYFLSFRVPGLAAALSVVTPLLSGCIMTPPSFPRGVSVSEVVHNARCELYDAIRANVAEHPWIANWGVGFNFTFTVDRGLDASTDSSRLVQLLPLSTFNMNFKGDIKQRATGTYVLDVKIPSLARFSEAGCGSGGDSTGDHGRLLQGEIWLEKWINDVVPEIEEGGVPNATLGEPAEYAKRRPYMGELRAMSYTIEFGLTVDGSLIPSWKLTYPNKTQTNPLFNVTATEIVKHKLIVALAPLDLPKPPPAPVKVAQAAAAAAAAADAKKETALAQKEVDHAKAELKAATERANAPTPEPVQQQQQQQPPNVERGPSTDDTGGSSTRGSVFESRPAQPTNDVAAARQRQLIDSQRQLERNRALLEAERKLLEAERKAKAAATMQDDARVQARVQASRATQDAEAENTRKLDNLIQQQIIRDAFRQ